MANRDGCGDREEVCGGIAQGVGAGVALVFQGAHGFIEDLRYAILE